MEALDAKLFLMYVKLVGYLHSPNRGILVQHGFEINTLTVVANEGYEKFAKELQTEIENETGIRFGIVEEHQFAGLTVKAADGSVAPLGVDKSKELQEHLRAIVGSPSISLTAQLLPRGCDRTVTTELDSAAGRSSRSW